MSPDRILAILLDGQQPKSNYLSYDFKIADDALAANSYYIRAISALALSGCLGLGVLSSPA
jgi:hypothetical protein